jgi:hypothetical protein
VGTPERTLVNLRELKEKIAEVEPDLRSLSVDNVYELGSMLLLGEGDIDSLVGGAPIHTDNRPILEYSDMNLYNVVDVAPNLGRLIEFQVFRALYGPLPRLHPIVRATAPQLGAGSLTLLFLVKRLPFVCDLSQPVPVVDLDTAAWCVQDVLAFHSCHLPAHGFFAESQDVCNFPTGVRKFVSLSTTFLLG